MKEKNLLFIIISYCIFQYIKVYDWLCIKGTNIQFVNSLGSDPDSNSLGKNSPQLQKKKIGGSSEAAAV